jgi:glycosyltransferase involved in cell wall biosynthesis
MDGVEHPEVHDDFLPNEKIRLAFYIGGFGANGVTSAFRALLSRIDRNKYDITVWGLPSDFAGRQNFRNLVGVRPIPRFGTFTLTRWEAYGIEYVMRYGLDGPLARIFRPVPALARDYHRTFGDARFDYVIDYSGYGIIFPAILRQASGAKKIIWQHSDMSADLRSSKGKLQRYKTRTATVTGLRETYRAFDRIVACGEHIMSVNINTLKVPDISHKFTYANNLIEIDRVNALLTESEPFTVPGYIAVTNTQGRGVQRPVLIPTSPMVAESTDPFYKFITIGRLSPEKNQANLIRGFARFVDTHPNSRLYIVGGGEIAPKLKALAVKLGIEDNVAFTGHLRNPFALARHCDCFILPSRYEGFGLVVPEMRMLGLPIILSNFGAAPSVSVPNGQLVVGFGPDDIHEGLLAYARGEVPADYEFDAEAYNDHAYAQFEEMLRTT